MVKEKILEYIKLNPNIGYFDLVKVFGLSMENLLELLDIKNYKIKNKYINFYDTNDNKIYYEDSSGYWIKRGYDADGNFIYREDSDGDWEKRKYDINGELVYEEHSNGYKYER